MVERKADALSDMDRAHSSPDTSRSRSQGEDSLQRAGSNLSRLSSGGEDAVRTIRVRARHVHARVQAVQLFAAASTRETVLYIKSRAMRPLDKYMSPLGIRSVFPLAALH